MIRRSSRNRDLLLTPFPFLATDGLNGVKQFFTSMWNTNKWCNELFFTTMWNICYIIKHLYLKLEDICSVCIRGYFSHRWGKIHYIINYIFVDTHVKKNQGTSDPFMYWGSFRSCLRLRQRLWNATCGRGNPGFCYFLNKNKNRLRKIMP